MTDKIAKPPTTAGAMERVVIMGDLSPLTERERIDYYARVCHSLGLNPLTQPFGYLHLNGKLQLYAKRECTDQLRTIKGVSITGLERELDEDGVYTVTAHARDQAGREDLDVGCVNLAGLKGETKANAKMKATTKAKRRVTLSICGLAMLDESELEDTFEAQVERAMDGPPPRELDAERAALKAAIEEELRRRGASKRDAKIFFRAYLGADDPQWDGLEPAVMKELLDKLREEPPAPGAA